MKYFDYGYFASNAKRLMIFLIAPLTAMITMLLVLNAILASATTLFEDQRSYLALRPIVAQQIAQAQKVLSEYDIDHGEAEAIGMLNERLQDFAQESGFFIESLDVKEGKKDKQGVNAVKVVTKGRGTLIEFNNFIDNLQSSSLLSSITELRLNYRGDQLSRVYDIQCSLNFYFLGFKD